MPAVGADFYTKYSFFFEEHNERNLVTQSHSKSLTKVFSPWQIYVRRSDLKHHPTSHKSGVLPASWCSSDGLSFGGVEC